MSLSGSQRYNFNELRENIDNALLNEEMPDKLYKSVDGFSRMINAILTTKGDNWATHVLDENGKPLLTSEEQVKFTDLFKPYKESINNFFNSDKRDDDNEITGGAAGIDDVYTKIINSINNVDSIVNDYASKYGVLKLEKEHDLESNIGMPPFTGPLPPPFTPATPVLMVLSKIKVPFRTIITIIYLILDITRIAMGSAGSNIGRKILSVLVALLELLRGDWKKAILTAMGFYGMSPMLTGQLLKVFLTVFRMLSPDIQKNIIFGPLNIIKSLIVGLLLSIFQVTAPAFIRKPLIESLNKIAERKAQIDGTLADVGLPERPDYLSPSWNDLNNIQAVISDKVYICSCEFRDLVKAVDNSTIIKIVLQILRIPVTKEMIIETCGKEECKTFSTLIVKEGIDAKSGEQIVPVVTPAVPIIPTAIPTVPTVPTVPIVPVTSTKPVKKPGLLRRGLGELGAFAQNSLLTGGNPHGKRIVRRGGL